MKINAENLLFEPGWLPLDSVPQSVKDDYTEVLISYGVDFKLGCWDPDTKGWRDRQDEPIPGAVAWAPIPALDKTGFPSFEAFMALPMHPQFDGEALTRKQWQERYASAKEQFKHYGASLPEGTHVKGYWQAAWSNYSTAVISVFSGDGKAIWLKPSGSGDESWCLPVATWWLYFTVHKLPEK